MSYLNNKGFTLVEVMVSISIMAIVTVMSIASFYSTKKENDRQSVARTIASDVRKAESYALGLKEFSSGVIPSGGWGIYFNKTNLNNKKYSIFADLGSPPNKIFDEATELLVEKNIVGAKVNNITLFDSGGVSSNHDSVNITFLPPEPTIYICADSTHCDYTRAEIGVITDSGATSTISINNLGLVDVD